MAPPAAAAVVPPMAVPVILETLLTVALTVPAATANSISAPAASTMGESLMGPPGVATVAPTMLAVASDGVGVVQKLVPSNPSTAADKALSVCDSPIEASDVVVTPATPMALIAT